MSTANNLDKVLEYIYGKLLEATDNYERACEQMEIINHNLEISIKFVTELLFSKTQSSQKCRKIVNGIIGYEKESTEYGWEEKVMCNSSHFLNKRFNYTNDKFTFDQVYKIVIWVITKVNSGEWN